jgi:signal transduction histidine kinase
MAFGPIGAVASGVAEALGVYIRSRNGWFRTLFNVSDHFLSNLSAWAVFIALTSGHTQPLWLFITGSLCGALAHYVVNYGMLTGVIEIAESQPPIMQVLQRWLSRLPYSVGYGLSAWTLVLMYRQAGVIGFVALVIPVLLLQGFLVLFARRVEAYELQQAAHQKEREALLQQAVDASEAERRRIARDLHDGVVQNLAGMAFTLTATASEMKEQGDVNGNAGLLELLESSAEETRAAMKDLRTLIIEIAPPTLRREGLHAALLEVLRTIESGGTQTRLELPSNMRLRQDRASLIFRVAQEVLRNVAAHAEASHVSVTLKEMNKMAVLRITDDGKGFTQADVARRRAEGHVGTNAIVELAEEAGGTLDIHSQPGKGTRVTLKVPTE